MAFPQKGDDSGGGPPAASSKKGKKPFGKKGFGKGGGFQKKAGFTPAMRGLGGGGR
jgi:hypothetical protein